MAFSVTCPKCKRKSAEAFDWKLGQKFVVCRCGKWPAEPRFFDPNPEYLFKYRPHDQYSESWILNEEFFFASPSMFNDPFDSKVMYTVEGTAQQKRKYWNRLIEEKSPGIGRRKKWQILNMALDSELLEKNYNDHIARMQKRIDEGGVVSFSQKPDDLLMFSYYARDHSGYCLKYRRLADNILSMAKAIKYEECYPKFSLFDSEFEVGSSIGDRVLFTKAKCWQHENEWRLGLAGLPNRIMKSPHPILAGIILGCNMKPDKRAEVLALNKRRSKPVEIFEARKKKFEFALEIFSLDV